MGTLLYEPVTGSGGPGVLSVGPAVGLARLFSISIAFPRSTG